MSKPEVNAKAVDAGKAMALGENPYDTATWWEHVVFKWPAGLLEIGAQTTLEHEHLPPPPQNDRCTYLLDSFMEHWEEERKREDPWIVRTLYKTFVGRFGLCGLMGLAEIPLKIYQAMLLGSLIGWLVDEPDAGYLNNGYTLAAGISLTGALTILLHHHFFMYVWRCGMQLRVAMIAVIYNKAIKLDMKALSKTASGHVVNLASHEVEVLQGAGCFVHYLWLPIVEAAMVSVVGCWYIGPSFMVGVGTIMLLVPLQGIFSRKLGAARRASTKETDGRLKIVNQALQGARLMKMNAWEFAMSSMVETVRGRETHALLQTNYLRGLNEAIFFSAPVVVSAMSFFTYSATGGELKTSAVFAILVMFSMLQFTMCKFFALGVEFWTQALVALNRIQKLLLLDEYSEEPCAAELACTDADMPRGGEGVALFMDNLSATWEAAEAEEKEEKEEKEETVEEGKEKGEKGLQSTGGDGYASVPSSSEPRMALKNVSLTVNTGDLVVVVGSVGSSKSSLLYVVLKELECMAGSKLRIDHGGKGVSYCSQDPWIMSTTVRENILFGKPLDQERYNLVCAACALTEDMATLQHGDETVIGDKGVNLSGGQRARVGLARALYADTGIVLMDDPLSAVDTKVSKHIFERTICGAMAGKTRVLVTHQVQYLGSEHVSNIVVMSEGGIKTQGKYEDLLARGDLNWVDGLNEQGKDAEKEAVAGKVAGAIDTTRAAAAAAAAAVAAATAALAAATETPKMMMTTEAASPEQVGLELAEVAARKKATFEGRANVENGLIIAEDREAGFVRKSTYTSYMHHMGGNLWVGFLLLIMAIGQGFQIATNLYLASWSSMDKEDQQASSSYVVYGLLVAGTAIAACTRSYFGFRSTVLASESLHNAMLRAVVRAPVLFFDQNPLGRVLNRFAKDIGCVDDVLPMVLFDFVQCCLMVVSAIIIACSAVPITFIALIPLVWYFLKLRSYYLLSSREIKRLDGMSRSPILGILTESLDGLPTIRAFQRQTDFAKTHRTLVDDNSKAYFMFIACSRWLGFRLDAIVVAMLLIASFGAVIAKENGSPVDPKLLAVGMLYVIQLSGLFQWCVRQSCEVENLMTSVERVLGFTNLPAEPALHGPTDMTARPDWPEHGEVIATDLQCSYRSDLEPVIKGISFRLKPGKRCGVVGRTGAGKSTLVAAFLRLVDTTAGKIEIDGLDVSQVGLHDLRPKMSVIPQTPFLFSGSLRHNLDPFTQFTDEQIWAAIDASGSITRLVVERLGGGLEGYVEDNGGNFSVGERQLLCLARAVLSRNKIIVMDEATANLDNETDAAVQDAIRTSFSESTVIIIAHRLQTIMDCEQVVVMNGGHIAEAGHPHELLNKYFGQGTSSSSSGLLAEMDKDPSKVPPRESLAGMVRETGPLMTAFLRKMALTAFNQR